MNAKNCEANSLLVLARPTGPTCHTGHDSCYYRPLHFSGLAADTVANSEEH